jgi:hypothetical protein
MPFPRSCRIGGGAASNRRGTEDRRSGLDRRGSGARSSSTRESRPYGFREFEDRRRAQDRRTYGLNDVDWASPPRTWSDPVWHDSDNREEDLYIDVTPRDVDPKKRR